MSVAAVRHVCPSLSPETESPCVLPDDPDKHLAGHESARVDGARAVWGTRKAEWARWRVLQAVRAGDLGWGPRPRQRRWWVTETEHRRLTPQERAAVDTLLREGRIRAVGAAGYRHATRGYYEVVR